MDFGSGAPTAAAAALFAVGLGFGAVAERAGFCTMGAIADVVLFGGYRRARIWAAALTVAALVVHAAALAGWGAPAAGPAWRVDALGLALVGGLLFGVGMVSAGGCVSRAWIRAASGSVKGGAVLAAATLAVALTAAVAPRTLGEPASLPTAVSVAGLAAASGLAFWVLRDARFRRARGPLATGAAIGALVAAAGLLGTPFGVDGIRFVVPFAGAFDGPLGPALPGLAIVLGTAVGAAASALAGGRFRGERWAGRGDVGSHVAGGVAMGVGGTLAFGCTVGAGITGAAALAPSAWCALAGMVAGATLALRVLLAGGPTALWRRLRRRPARSG